MFIKYISNRSFLFVLYILERIRVLPVLIFMCFLSFSFKVTHSAHDIYLSFSRNSVIATEDIVKKDKDVEHKKSDLIETQGKLPRLVTDVQEIAKITNKQKETNDKKEIDMLSLTPEAIKNLHDMTTEYEVQKERTDHVDNLKELLRLQEQRLDEKLSEIKKAEVGITGLLGTFQKSEDEKLKKIINMVEQLPPKKAAPMFENMEVEEIVSLIESMKDSKTSAIMALMSPEKSAKITKALLARHQKFTEKRVDNQRETSKISETKGSPSPLPAVPKF